MNITVQKHSLRLDTKNYTLEDILAEVKEDFTVLVSLGYTDLLDKDVIVNYGKRICAYGTCRRVGRVNNKMRYEIKINKDYLKVGDPKDVHNTIMHECIHCIDGCMNHGEKWKTAAAKVNARFDFSPIQRTGCDEAYRQIVETKYKYFAVCEGCQSVYKWMRKSKTYTACCNNRARCSCGSKKFTCSENLI